MKRNPVLIIFFTVFLDLVGFGMIIPLNPYLAREFGAGPFEVGLLMAVYSLMQFVCSPFWGKLSDRIGRRPVILVSLLGVGLAHLAFSFSQTYTLLFCARLLAGGFGGNISTAMAYIADVTPQNERSKGMGLIGAAFGLGFLVGPFLGGVMSIVGSNLGSQPPLGPSFPALVAAVLCFLNVGFAYKFLGESLKTRVLKKREPRFLFLITYLTKPVIGQFMIIYFCASLAMAHMEASLFLFMQDQFGWNLMRASFGFAYVGIVMVFTQGYLIRKLLPIYGERVLLVWGLSFSMVGFLGIALAPSILLMAVAVTFLGLGNGLANPSLSGSISLLTNEEDQGKVLGLNQSLSALGRVIGPATGGLVYQGVSRQAPFLAAAALMLVGFGLAFRVAKEIPDVQRRHPHPQS